MGMIGDGFLSIGESILRFFYTIPVLLYETIVDMFPAIGDFFSELFSGIASKVGSFFINLLPNWAQKLLGLGDSEESGGGVEPVMMADGGLANRGAVNAVVGEAGAELITPLSEVGNLVDMSGVIAGLADLKQAVLKNKDFYVGKEALGSVVTDAQERGGRKNNFGVGVA